MEKSKNRRRQWLTTLAFAGFTIVAVVGMLLMLTGRVAASPAPVALTMLAGGFAVMGAGVVPKMWRSSHPPAATLSTILTIISGLLLWSATPIIMLLLGADWSTTIGSGHRSLSVWMLALITWGLTATVIVVVAVGAYRNRAAHRKNPG